MYLTTVVFSLSKRFFKNLELCYLMQVLQVQVYLFTKLPPSLIMTLKIEQIGQSLVELQTELDFTQSFSYNCSLLQEHWRKFKLV